MLSNERYMKYYKKGFATYIPEAFTPRFKPRIIDKILKGDKTIGKVAGINLKPVDLRDEKDLHKYIKAIENLKNEEYNRLYMEGQEDIDDQILDYLQEALSLEILNGRDLRIKSLPLAMRMIYGYLKENLEDREVLVLCDQKDTVKEVIKEISKDVKLITITGCSPEENEEIYDYVFEEVGLSVFYPSKIEKVIGNYSIIINFMDSSKFDFSRVRRNSILFNFSNYHILDNNRLAVIEDFGFDLRDIGIRSKWINSKISTTLYENLLGREYQELKYLYCKNQYYLIKDYISLYLKVKGHL